jgi:uncharacterized protein DUF3291
VIHLAQVNIARMRGPLERAVMADFVARLDDRLVVVRALPGVELRLAARSG